MHRIGTRQQLDRGELITVVQRTLAQGATRVVINADAEGVSPKRALERGIVPDVIFVRDDGWTLGAPHNLVDVARRTWSESWVAVINVSTKTWRSYAEWSALLS